MSKIFSYFIAASLLILFFVNPVAAKKKILVFSKTAGFHHTSIKAGIAAIQKLGLENKFVVDTTIDATKINYQNLKKYAAVVFLSTTGDIFNDEQQAAFERYIKNGGGYVGIHAATDTEYGWPWYGKLAGAYFSSHPAQQMADLIVVNRSTIATQHLPEIWKRKDEWYNFKDIGTDLNVLIKIDEGSYNGGTNGNNHPVAWYHNFDGGRAFYTALGHVEESYTDPLFLKHILGGIQYAMGIKKMEL
ncbi:MAG: ThuA domain-containing protein [Candidatus Pedobacter colombiensis]|uniref:ThuA domain-containing protein n=1 Tax=Candidatus Pedobacter colombiensis TaxID=3121371 RepID=A0AAJ5WC49_9SPHI|nr:ThuA domain-containing protein [Pedobacter sp.]WEK19992.1 MAG: ThuA domain-containing protein [Pedobacter sp.]